MGALNPRPSRRDAVEALLLAAVCSLLFLGSGVSPTRSVVPFAPELYQPARAEALADGRVTAEELDHGNVSMGDKYNQSLAWDRIMQTRLRDGELPAWTRDIAGGAPFVPQMAQVYEPWNLLLLLPIDSAGLYGLGFFLHQVLFGLFAWWFLRRIGLSQTAALFGLACAVLGLWTQAKVHHNVIVTAALPLFALLSLIHATFHEGPGPGRTALIALGTGLSWLGGFAPVSLQVSYLCVAWAGFCAWRTREYRPLLFVGIGMALGGLLAVAQMGPTLVAASISAREAATVEQLRASGLSWLYLGTLIWPDLLHWPAQALHDGHAGPAWAALEWLPPDKARGFNYPETAFALGLPAVLLAGSALVRPKAEAVLFAVVAFVGFGLATATTPFVELTAVLPGARAGDQRRFLFLVAMGLTVLAAFGAQELSQGQRAPVLAKVAVVVLVASFVPMLTCALGSSDLQWFRELFAERLAGMRDGTLVTKEMVLDAMSARPYEAADNVAMLLWTYGRTTVLAAAVALVFRFVHRRALVPALIALTIVELIAVGHGTIVPVARERVTTPPLALGPVLAATRAAPAGVRPRLQRLRAPLPPGAAGKSLDLLPPNLGAFFGVEDLSSYNPLPPRRMEELFLAIEPDAPGAPSVVTRGAGVLAFSRPETLDHPLLDLLGVRFILSGRDDLATGARLADRTPAATPRPFRLYERTTTWPRATFVDRIEVIADEDERLRRLGDPARDARAVAILEDPTAPRADGDGVADADVEIVDHRDERVYIRVVARESGYLRLADPFDPGWTATVDDVRAEVYAADHYLRAVRLEPGTHEVVFRYDGGIVVWPRRAALAALLWIFALSLLWWRRRRGSAAKPGD